MLLAKQCPFCEEPQEQKVIKNWKYGKVSVERYQCTCGEKFNYYITENGKKWTVPKPKISDLV